MKRATLILSGVVALGLLSGCGGSYIILEIHADLQIPDDVDRLTIVTQNADGSSTLNVADLQLEASQSFPIDVLLEPGDTTPNDLREQVSALKAGTEKAAAEVIHPWSAGRVNRAKIDLNPLP